MHIRCSHCQTKSKWSAKFCRECGEAFNDKLAMRVTVAEPHPVTCAGQLMLEISEVRIGIRHTSQVTLVAACSHGPLLKQRMYSRHRVTVSHPTIGDWSVKLVWVHPWEKVGHPAF
jgi:predicted amidophosphoribosyltransferase